MKKINVIISTNKSHHYLINLKELINQIINQKGNFDTKIIIVHQHQDLYTIKKFKKFFKKKNVLYKNINFENLSISKNIGLKLSKSNLITFIDDDVKIKKNYFNVCYEYFKRTGCDALFSRLGSINSNKPFLLGMRAKDTNINYFNTRSCLSTTLWIKNHSKLKINFDENFGLGSRYGSGEETDLIFQLLQKKKKIYYSAEIGILHSPEFNNLKDLKNIYKKFFKYGEGQGALLKKYIYQNKLIFLSLLIISIIKSIGGVLIYIIFFDLKKITKYYSMLIGKIIGFINFKL